MPIAVISDTHDHLPAGLAGRLAAADEIWHLGDVCAPETLVELEALRRPLRIVQGNCDHYPWPLSLNLTRGGLSCHLTHIPPHKAPVGAKVVLHGHTHVPRDQTDARGVRWLNPGCISRANRGAPASFAWLSFEREGHLTWSIVRLD